MTERMTDAELAAIEARANAATPGPWLIEKEYSGGDWMIGTFVLGKDPDDRCMYAVTTDRLHASELGESTARTDAEFIARAREDVPALLAEVRQLRAEVREAKLELIKVFRD